VFFLFFFCFLLTPLVSFPATIVVVLLSQAYILHHKALSLSLHSRLGVFGRARRSSWWSVERAGAKVRSYTISLSSSSYLPSTKLPPFLYTLVLASLDTPGGAPGDPWGGRPRAPVLRFVPILSLSSGWRSEVERAPCYFNVLVVVVVWSGARLVTLVSSFVSCSEALALVNFSLSCFVECRELLSRLIRIFVTFFLFATMTFFRLFFFCLALINFFIFSTLGLS